MLRKANKTLIHFSHDYEHFSRSLIIEFKVAIPGVIFSPSSATYGFQFQAGLFKRQGVERVSA
jgi:hypothetical protein